MTGDLRELLPLYALGILETDEASVVERAIASDAALAAERRQLPSRGVPGGGSRVGRTRVPAIAMPSIARDA